MNLPQIVGQTVTDVTVNCYQRLCLLQPQSELRGQPLIVDGPIPYRVSDVGRERLPGFEMWIRHDA